MPPFKSEKWVISYAETLSNRRYIESCDFTSTILILRILYHLLENKNALEQNQILLKDSTLFCTATYTYYWQEIYIDVKCNLHINNNQLYLF